MPGEVGSVSFVVPPLTESRPGRLHLRLREPGGRRSSRATCRTSPSSPAACFRPPVTGEPIWVHDPFDIWDLEERLREAGYQVVNDSWTTQRYGNPRTPSLCRIDERRGPASWRKAAASCSWSARPTTSTPQLTARTGIRVRDRRARMDIRTREKNPWEGDWITNYNWVKHEPLFERIPRTCDSPLQRRADGHPVLQGDPEPGAAGLERRAGVRATSTRDGGRLGPRARHAAGASAAGARASLLATTLKLESAFGDDPVATRPAAQPDRLPRQQPLPRPEGRPGAPPRARCREGLRQSAAAGRPLPEGGGGPGGRRRLLEGRPALL